MKKLFILLTVFSGYGFALSLGDTVTSSTVKNETTTNSVMKLSAQTPDHDEYTITKPTGTNTVLVNKQQQVYGFKWNDSKPDLVTMLGKYKPEFDTAYANRAKGDHRRLIINTQDLSVQQFGLPGGPFQGQMYAKDLEPGN